ncbi:hypothetical protein C3941_04400 [Kaistia algarum]|uniref:PqqD family protein n=1 Tax=Kaistia algarum TaxID=2083279 RepID=UPI000CE8D5A2|nr:PqqD family protein [Kaistia algarum]MCX5512541.1 PqqD family protein [Kaistia algarum]PPE81931.1 hypothetical protein C3941_04400 [Kaistia algarum]
MTDGKPRIYRRVGGLECSEVPDGYVIYDDRRAQVHYLNLTAAAVLELCDGRCDDDEIAEVLQRAFGLASAPVQDVGLCLDSLLSQHLIE